MADKIKADDAESQDTIIIKKYANRRLYNMAASKYVTLEDLAQLIREGVDFVVYDAKSGEDITRSILTQIIFEEEGKGKHLLPMSFLRDMISFYGDNVNNFVPDYWEASMGFFKTHREKMQSGFARALDHATFPFEQFQKVADNNRDIMKKTFDMFNSFGQNIQKTAQDEEKVVLTKKEYDALLAEIKALKTQKK